MEDNLGRRIVMIGAGMPGLRAAIDEAGIKGEIEVVDFAQGSFEEKVSDEMDRENSYIEYNNKKPYLLKDFPQERIKATCKKHHEYINNGGKWSCRHCQKSL